MILSLWFQVQVRLALGRNCAHKDQKGLKYLTQGSVQIQALRKILCILARDNHSRLLRKSVNYAHKKFYRTGPRRKRLSFLKEWKYLTKGQILWPFC